MSRGHWPAARAGSCCARRMLTCTCAAPLGPASSAKASTQLTIIGLDSIPTALRYRIEDKEELESSTQDPYGLEPTLGLHVDSSCKADPIQKIQWDCPK